MHCILLVLLYINANSISFVGAFDPLAYTAGALQIKLIDSGICYLLYTCEHGEKHRFTRGAVRCCVYAYAISDVCGFPIFVVIVMGRQRI